MKESNLLSQKKLEATPDAEFILGSLFLAANRLQTLLDREFEPCGMTAKQWFLSIVIGGAFDDPPTLSAAAAAMGSTHQNVKQVALKLKEKGFLEIVDDAEDGRAVRLRLTEQSGQFWMGLQRRGEEFMADMYQGLDQQELAALRAALGKIMANISKMDEQQQRVRREKE